MSDFAIVKNGIVIDRVIGQPLQIAEGLISIKVTDQEGFIGQLYSPETGFAPLPVATQSTENARRWRLAELKIKLKNELDEKVPNEYKHDGVSLSDDFMFALQLGISLANTTVQVVAKGHEIIELSPTEANTMLLELGKVRGEILSRYQQAAKAVRAATTLAEIKAVEA